MVGEVPIVRVKGQGATERPSQRAESRGSTANVCWTLAAIIALSLGIDLFFFNGYYASDDNQYWRGALAILDGRFPPHGPALGEMRLPLTGWNALIVALVGPRIQLVAASYGLFHQLLNLATFALGARLFRARVGLLAAYLSALTPLLISYSTMSVADIPLALWIVLSFLAFHEAYRWRARRRDTLAGLLLFASGLCAGLAYATKEAGLIVLPFYLALWLVLERRTALDQGQQLRWRSACGYGTRFAAGVAAVFIAETVTLSVLSDRLTFRMGWTTSDIAATRVERVERVAGLNPIPRAERAYSVLTDDRLLPPTLRGILLFGLVVYPFVRRRPWSLCLFPLWMFAYLTWGTMNLSRYIPPNIHLRYYTMLFPFLFVVTSAGLCRLWEVASPRIPFRVVRAGTGVIGLAAIVVTPMTWLGAPNRMTGGLFRTERVAMASRAVAYALGDSTRSVVMSGSISRLLENVLVRRRPDQLVDAKDVTPELLHGLAEQGGFEYVYIRTRKDRERDDPYVTATTFDLIMQRLIRGRSARLPEHFPWPDVVVKGRKVTPSTALRLQLGDDVFTVRERMRLRRAATRLEDVWALIGNEAQMPAPSRDRVVATVYSVDAERIAAHSSATGAAHSRPAAALSRQCAWRARPFTRRRAEAVSQMMVGCDVQAAPGRARVEAETGWRKRFPL